METIWGIIAAVAAGAVLGFWGWIAVRTIDQGRKIAELEQRMNSNDHLHDELMVWLRSMDAKLNIVCETVAGLNQAFKHFGIERRGVGDKREKEREDWNAR